METAHIRPLYSDLTASSLSTKHLVHPYSSICLGSTTYIIFNADTGATSTLTNSIGQNDEYIIDIRGGCAIPGLAVIESGSFTLESFAKIHFTRPLTIDEETVHGLCTDVLHTHINQNLQSAIDVADYRDRCVAIVSSLFGSNFGHWHIETLASIRLAQSIEPGSYIAVPKINSWQAEVLRCSGLDLSRLIEFDSTIIVRSSRLLYPSPCWLYGSALQFCPREYLYASILSCQRTALLESTIQSNGRLFIARPDAGNRKLVNSKELEVLMAERYSFTIISPEKLPYTDQVKLFSTADCIVGCSGAAFTLLPFARDGCTVVELSYKGGWHNFWSSWSAPFARLNYIVYEESENCLERLTSIDGLAHPNRWKIDTHKIASFLDSFI